MQLKTTFLDLVFPPRCGSCSAFVGMQGSLCPECWKLMAFISDPQCPRCGHPFEYAMGGEHPLCGECLREMPAYTQSRSVFRYDDASKSLIHGFKYNDRTHMAPVFGMWLMQAGKEFLPQCELLTPVPLHTRRLISRRYNQAAMLCHALHRATQIPLGLDTLRRVRHTQPQAGLTRTQRHDNVQGAFRVNPKRKEALRGKNVLLVDDVMTTGATINACTNALLKAGALNVYVLTLAKTVTGD